MRYKGKIRGRSYRKRIADINRIYDEHARSGLSNREILRRYIYPIYPISESTFYNILKAEGKLAAGDTGSMPLFPPEAFGEDKR